MPRGTYSVLIVLVVLATIPFVLIARARATKSDQPRIHLIDDMDSQPKYRAQSANPAFADGRAMRPPVPGTVARGQLMDDDLLYRGRVGDQWATDFPMPLTDEMLRRGQARFAIYCAPCHGLGGYGDGIVAKRADRLQEGTWVPPSSYHTDLVRSRPVGQIFNTITNGIRNMPAYGPQIPVVDRWAIVAYVRALQRSQNARIEDVPSEFQGTLK